MERENRWKTKKCKQKQWSITPREGSNMVGQEDKNRVISIDEQGEQDGQKNND